MGMTGSSIDTSALQSGITSGGSDQNAFANMRRQFYQNRGGKSGGDTAYKDSSHLQALKDLKYAGQRTSPSQRNDTLFDHLAGTAPPPVEGTMFHFAEWGEGIAHVIGAEMKQEHG